MGFVSELKKLFFGVESVGKSAINETKKNITEAADRAGDEISKKTSGLKESIIETSENTLDSIKSSDVMKKTQTKLDEVSDRIEKSAEELSHKASVALEGFRSGETMKKAQNTIDSVSEKVQNAASDIAEKAADVSEKIGTTVFGENNERLEKAKDFTEDIGKKVLDAKEKMIDRARDIKEDIDESIDETIEKAKEMEAMERAQREKSASTPPTSHGDSLLKDDDFFSKADKYAKGEYSAFSEGKITIDPDKPAQPKKDGRTAAGFEDLDGDGNEIVDDAILDDDSANSTD